MNKIELSSAERRRAGRLATLSSCCGVTGETTLTDSAVIILFAAALGAGDMLTLISTSMLPFFNGLLLIPGALIATKIGRRKLILGACTAATCAYLLAASAPFFGQKQVAVLLGAILFFTLSTPGFIACWNPLLDSFLNPEERVRFLSRMRFLHQLCAIGFLFVVGLVIGTHPSVCALQWVLLAGAVIFAGRGVSIALIPDFTKGQAPEKRLSGLKDAVRDRELTFFSVYQFILNLMIYGGIPVATLYMKNGLHVPGNWVVHVSNAGLVGMLMGYLGAISLQKRISARQAFIGLHVLAVAVNFALIFIAGTSGIELLLLAFLLWSLGVIVAASSVYCSAEMMNLAPAGNKLMAMAWSGAFFYCGSGCSRLFSSFLLNNDAFRTPWKLGTLTMTPYQTLFLLYAVLLVPALWMLFRIRAVRSSI